MTMITASTALTIFIMNIHHCGPEAYPVPEWARRFVLHYLAQICFVHEVGENCLGRNSPKKDALSQEPEVPPGPRRRPQGPSWEVNGQAWGGQGGRAGEDRAGEPLKTGAVEQTDWKEDLFVSIDHSEEEGAAGGCEGEKWKAKGGGGGCAERGRGIGGAEGGGGRGAGPGGGLGEKTREILVKTQCLCQHQGLSRNVEYIANCYQDQRSTQRRIGEWRKVAKVMDRFFMWLFFIMVFLMSLLIMGKAI